MSSNPQNEGSLFDPERFFNRIERTANNITAISMLLLIAILVWMVIARNVFSIGQPWLNDLARYAMIWLVFIAAVPLTIKGDQITMDVVYIVSSERVKRWIRYLTGVTTVLAALIGLITSFDQMMTTVGQTSPSGAFPAVVGYIALPISFLFMLFAAIYYTFYVAPRSDSEVEVETVG